MEILYLIILLIGIPALILWLGDLIDKRRDNPTFPSWIFLLVIPILSLCASAYVYDVLENGFSAVNFGSLALAIILVIGTICYVFLLFTLPEFLTIGYEKIRKMIFRKRNS